MLPYLHMVKQEQENHIQYKDINKKVYFKCVYKIYSIVKKLKIKKYVDRHQ